MKVSFITKWRMKHALSGAALLFMCVSAQAATLMFSDDFEDGNLSGWSASPANSASQEQAHSGSWALKYDSRGNTNGNMRHTFSGRQRIYVRYWWLPTSEFTCGSGGHYLRITHQFQDRQLDSQCTGSRSFEFVGFYGTTVYPAGSIRNININQWNLVELFFELNDVGQSNGRLTAWLNGVEQFDKTNTRWRNNSDPISEFHINSNFNPSQEIWYFDDVEIWDDLPDRAAPLPPAQLDVQ